MTLQEAANWTDNTDNIIDQFKHLINLSMWFGEEWLKSKNKDLYKQVMAEGDYTYEHCVKFEQEAYRKSNYNLDGVINMLSQRAGYDNAQCGIF